MKSVLNKKKINFPEVGKNITPLQEDKNTLKQMYKLKNVNNLIFFKYLTIISFIAWAGCVCLVFTAYRVSNDIFGFITLTSVVPFVLQTIYLLALQITNKWLSNKNWLQTSFGKTKYNKAQILTIIIFISFIMANGGTYILEVSNIMFMLMLFFTALAFYDTNNIILGIIMHSILKIFEFLILVKAIPLSIALTVTTILPFLFYNIYRKIYKKRGETNEKN